MPKWEMSEHEVAEQYLGLFIKEGYNIIGKLIGR